MKRILALLLTGLLLYLVTGCRAQTDTDIHTYNVGDVVSTDIMELSIDKVSLGYYANKPEYSSSDKTVSNIEEACEPTDDSDAFYISSKGRCLLCVTFTLKNKDRIKRETNDYIVEFQVKQNEVVADVKGYDLNSKDGRWEMNLDNMAISTDNGPFKCNDTNNFIINPGTQVKIKYVGIIGFEPSDLSTPFELNVRLKNSGDQHEEFLYLIN